MEPKINGFSKWLSPQIFAFGIFQTRSLSGDWHEYWRFHLKQEHQRNHYCLYKDGIPLMKQVIQARCSLTPPPLIL